MKQVFSKNELKAIYNFESEHLNCYENNNPDRKNLGFTINQNWTGIGVLTNISCNCCGETKDVTDYETW